MRFHSAHDVLEPAVRITTKPRNTDLVIGHTTSGVEELRRMITKVRVVAAFDTVPSELPPIGELAYGGGGGPELAYRFERFEQPD